VYKQLLDFLNVSDDGRRGFIRENDFSRPKSRVIALLARSIQVNPILKKIRVRIKPILNRNGIHIIERTLQRNLVPAPRPQLASAFRQKLCEEFRADVSLLSTLLKRDLRYWLGDPASQEFLVQGGQSTTR